MLVLTSIPQSNMMPQINEFEEKKYIKKIVIFKLH